jgi:hypothetical protein
MVLSFVNKLKSNANKKNNVEKNNKENESVEFNKFE